MDKEKILSKSRMEKSDEGLAEAENKGRKIGVSAFTFVFCVIVLFNLFYGQDNDAAMTMYFSYIAAEAYPKYKFTGKRLYLFIVVISGIAAVFFLSRFVIITLR